MLKDTVIINLFGGPGAGKSTTAAGVFSELKLAGHSAELVTEYVKGWAWTNRPVTAIDQLYIFGKQSYREAQLYGKVKFIVTDSPIILSAFYEQKYSTCRAVTKALEEYLSFTENTYKAKRHNFWLPRKKKYDPNGRYQTEDQARDLECELEQFLLRTNVPFEDIRVEDRKRAPLIAKLMIGTYCTVP